MRAKQSPGEKPKPSSGEKPRQSSGEKQRPPSRERRTQDCDDRVGEGAKSDRSNMLVPDAVKEEQQKSNGDDKKETNSTFLKPERAMPNKPGEPEFQLLLTPDTLTFPWAPMKTPVSAVVTLMNTSRDKQCFKAKCTSTELFRVQPPMGFVNPGATMNIKVWYQNKAPRDTKVIHYFVFFHKKVAMGIPLNEVWAKNAKPDGVCRVASVFADPIPAEQQKK